MRRQMCSVTLVCLGAVIIMATVASCGTISSSLDNETMANVTLGANGSEMDTQATATMAATSTTALPKENSSASSPTRGPVTETVTPLKSERPTPELSKGPEASPGQRDTGKTFEEKAAAGPPLQQLKPKKLLSKGHVMLIGKPLPLLSRNKRVHLALNSIRTRRSPSRNVFQSRASSSANEEADPRELLALLALLASSSRVDGDNEAAGLGALTFDDQDTVDNFNYQSTPDDSDFRSSVDDSVKGSVPFVFGRPVQVLDRDNEPDQVDDDVLARYRSPFARSRQVTSPRRPAVTGFQDFEPPRAERPLATWGDLASVYSEPEPATNYLNYYQQPDADADNRDAAIIYTLSDLLAGQQPRRGLYNRDSRRKRSTKKHVRFM